MSTPTKVCTKCGGVFPATAEWFILDKRNKSGLGARCRKCCRKYEYEWRNANPEKMRSRKYKYSESNREKIRNASREWRVTNPKKARHSQQKYNESNPGKRDEFQRNYYKANREKICARERKRYRINPKQERERNRRYRTRLNNLPFNFGSRDEQRAIDYFHGCCAVCGRQLEDLFGEHKAAADHWIAISDARPDNPGTVTGNMIPLCHGVGGCNNFKGNKDPHEWLHQAYSARKADEIIARVEAYFEWVREEGA